MIEEDPKLEPVMAPSTNFAEELRSHVIPCIQTALLGSSELEVTDQASWMEIYVWTWNKLWQLPGIECDPGRKDKWQWLQDLVIVCQAGRELKSSALLIAAIFPWVRSKLHFSSCHCSSYAIVWWQIEYIQIPQSSVQWIHGCDPSR